MIRKNACVLMADGSEELEVVAIVDVLRRAGIGVFLAEVTEGRLVTASRGVRLAPDGAWDPEEAERFDALVIPGGSEGVESLAADSSVLEVLRQFAAEEKWVAAICAGPEVLHAAGLLDGKVFTCYPSCRGEIATGRWLDAPVVRTGHLLTSQGPGTAVAFALNLAALLVDETTAQHVAAGMLTDWTPAMVAED